MVTAREYTDAERAAFRLANETADHSPSETASRAEAKITNPKVEPAVESELLVLIPTSIRYQSTHASAQITATLSDAVELVRLIAEEIGQHLKREGGGGI